MTAAAAGSVSPSFLRPEPRKSTGTTSDTSSVSFNDTNSKARSISPRSVSSSSAGLGIGDFSVLGKLGEGGYGLVLMARHKSTNQSYALKMLLKANIQSDIQAERVLSEAAALSEISHPFIVSMLGAFQDELNIFFALEYVGGGDLWARLRSDGPMTEGAGRILLAEVALALEHIHSCGFMFRDLKPENVLVCTDGHIKLTDFGLAKKVVDKRQLRRAVAADGSARDTMRHSMMVGTPETLSPEVMGVPRACAPNGDYGGSVDWWGLGVLTCEVFTALETDVMVANGADAAGRQQLFKLYMQHDGSHLNEETLKTIPPAAADAVRRLLVVDVSLRLGCTRGLAEVRQHPFFAPLDFERKPVEHARLRIVRAYCHHSLHTEGESCFPAALHAHE